jgi:uncharacterized membrane protein
MKKYFITGLIILLPLVVTLWIVGFLINFLTDPFLAQTKIILSYLLMDHELIVTLVSEVLILLFIITFIILIGMGGELFFNQFLFFSLFHKIPIVNKIYKVSCELVQILLSKSAKSFSEVVLAPYPDSHQLSMGFITESLHLVDVQQQEMPLVSVFVPTAPNLTVGYLLLYKKEQLRPTQMKVDEAMKFVVSCGVTLQS